MKKIILLAAAFIFISGTIYAYSEEDIQPLIGIEYFSAVKNLIASAQKSIYMTMYIISYNKDYPKTMTNQFVNELVKAQKRGVSVHIKIDQDSGSIKGQYNDFAYFYLKDNGIDVSYDSPSQKLHSKLLIIDENIIIIGSHNWSRSALKDNRETSIVVKSPKAAKRYIEWIKQTPVLSRRTASPQAKTSDIYLPYQFMTDPEIGVKLSDMRMKLYLYLLKKWQDNKNQTIQLDYSNAADFIGINKNKTDEYRKNINKMLYILQDQFKLLRVEITRGQPAKIDLLDYKDKRKTYSPASKDCFAIPGSFFEFGWVQRLSASAKYFYFINLIETNIVADPQGWWTDRQKNLYKKYNADPRILSEGALELNRYNLLKTDYGDLIYPFSKYLTAPKYLQLPLYSWEWHERELLKLKEYYGEQKLNIARRWASVVLEENNLAVIEKLINYFNQYGGALVQYAVDKVSLKRIGNPKRTFAYIEGIILKEIQDQKDDIED